MFICGNNETAKKEVSDISALFGWETADFGLVESARAIEPLCMLWCIPGFLHNNWTHAFKLITTRFLLKVNVKTIPVFLRLSFYVIITLGKEFLI